MRTSAIALAALAATLGLGTVTSASAGRDDRDDRREARQDRKEQRREFRQERRADRREFRQERREFRHERRADRREFRQGHRHAQQAQRHYVQPSYTYTQPRYYSQPRYVYSQPQYVYTQPSYPRYHRGAYLPYQYRQSTYYVNDWHTVNGLYQPPYGHQWVQVGNDYLLIALATGLIANLLSM